VAETNSTEIRTELVLDDSASATLDTIREEFAAVAAEAAKAESIIEEMSNGTGDGMVKIAEGVKITTDVVAGVGEQYKEEFSEADKAIKQAQLVLKTYAEQVKLDMKKVDKSVDDSGERLKNLRDNFVSTFAAVNLMPAVNRFADFAMSFVHVGDEANNTEDGIADMLSAMTHQDWFLARAYAEDVSSGYRDLSISAGIAKKDIEAGHSTLATFLGGTTDAMRIAKDNMGSVVELSKVLGRPVAEVSQHIGKMMTGMVAMESPVFHLLRGTGIFASETKKVQEEWQKLTQEERINRLGNAIANIADNVSAAPPALEDLNNSIASIQEEFKETFGKAAIAEFIGSIGDLNDDLVGTRSEMKALAKTIGAEVGEFVKDAVNSAREAYAFIKENGDDIRDAVKEGFQFARDTMKWIMENKDALVMIGGAVAVSKTGVGGAVMQGVGGAALQIAGGAAAKMSDRLGDSLKGLAASGDNATKAGANVATMLGSLFSTIVAGGPAVWAATAAITALAAGAVAAVDAINEAEEKRNQTIDSNLDEYTQLTQKMGELSELELKRLDELKSEAEKVMGDKWFGQERVSDKFDAAWKERQDGIVKMYVHPMQQITEAIERYATKAEDEGLFPEEMGAQRSAVGAAVRLYEQAWKTHNDGAMKYIAR
jgi:hypothetical protein